MTTEGTLSTDVSEHDHQLGPADAPVSLLEYGDFECPFCGRAYPVVKEVRSRFEGRLRFAFRHFPRPEHAHARQAAEAAEAAGAQGEQHFWHMHDLLFEHQAALHDADLLAYAETCGLDVERFRDDLERHVYRERVHKDLLSAVHHGVHGTPTFFVNGQRYEGADTVAELVVAIEAELAKARRLTNT